MRVLGAVHPLTLGSVNDLATLDGRPRGPVAQQGASSERESERFPRLVAESRLRHAAFNVALARPPDPESQEVAPVATLPASA